MLRLVTSSERPAEKLLDLAIALADAGHLTERQLRVWQLKNFTTQSMYAIVQTLAKEGYLGYRNKPVSLRTVEADLQKASVIIDAADLKRQEKEDGEIRLAVVVQHGHHAEYVDDVTLRMVHESIGVGLTIAQLPPLRLAA